MEMRIDGTCSILNDDCPETTLSDCNDCELHQVVERYKEQAENIARVKMCDAKTVNAGGLGLHVKQIL